MGGADGTVIGDGMAAAHSQCSKEDALDESDGAGRQVGRRNERRMAVVVVMRVLCVVASVCCSPEEEDRARGDAGRRSRALQKII